MLKAVGGATRSGAHTPPSSSKPTQKRQALFQAWTTRSYSTYMAQMMRHIFKTRTCVLNIFLEIHDPPSPPSKRKHPAARPRGTDGGDMRDES